MFITLTKNSWSFAQHIHSQIHPGPSALNILWRLASMIENLGTHQLCLWRIKQTWNQEDGWTVKFCQQMNDQYQTKYLMKTVLMYYQYMAFDLVLGYCTFQLWFHSLRLFSVLLCALQVKVRIGVWLLFFQGTFFNICLHKSFFFWKVVFRRKLLTLLKYSVFFSGYIRDH